MAMIVLLKVALTCATPDGTLWADLFLCFNDFFSVDAADSGLSCLLKVKDSSYYFFLLATVLRRPFRVREFVLVRCPRTGRPKR